MAAMGFLAKHTGIDARKMEIAAGIGIGLLAAHAVCIVTFLTLLIGSPQVLWAAHDLGIDMAQYIAQLCSAS